MTVLGTIEVALKVPDEVTKPAIPRTELPPIVKLLVAAIFTLNKLAVPESVDAPLKLT